MRRAAIEKIIRQKEEQHRFDAAETQYSARQLEEIRVQTYDIKNVALRAREFIPVDNSINPGAEHVTYAQYTLVGQAVIITNYSQRLPRADAFRKEFTSRIRGIGNSYGWSIQEMRAAAFAKQPLDSRKASAARRAHDEKVDDIARNGDAAHGLIGFNNIPNTSTYVIPNGASNSTLWVNKTPDEILADMNGIVTSIIDSTKEIEHPTDLVLPTAQYQLIASKPRSANSDTTILEFFQKAHPEITVSSWSALKGAGAGGTDRMVAYVKDKEHLQLIIPLEFTQMAPEWQGLELVTNCESRCGGVQCYYPLSFAKGDGI